mgnify:FL=1
MTDARPKRAVLLVDWRDKLAAGLVNLLAWLAGYFPLNAWQARAEHYYDIPLTPLDALPLLPWTLLIYSTSIFNNALGLFLLPSKRAAWRYIGALLCAYLVNFICFFLLPTTIGALRAEVLDTMPQMGGLWAWGFELTHKADGPYNCFPSLHITNCAVVALAHWRGPWRYWMLGWAVLIAISTLTTKQHFFFDIPAGLLVALTGTLIARRVWGAPLGGKAEEGADQSPAVG